MKPMLTKVKKKFTLSISNNEERFHRHSLNPGYKAKLNLDKHATREERETPHTNKTAEDIFIIKRRNENSMERPNH